MKDIPIQEPEISTWISYDSTGKIIDINIDWKKFLKRPQEWQVEDLEWILEEVKKLPEERKAWMDEAAGGMETKVRWAGIGQVE